MTEAHAPSNSNMTGIIVSFVLFGFTMAWVAGFKSGDYKLIHSMMLYRLAKLPNQ